MKKQSFLIRILSTIFVLLILFFAVYNVEFFKTKENIRNDIYLLNAITEFTLSSEQENTKIIADQLIKQNPSMEISVYSVDNNLFIYNNANENFDDKYIKNISKKIWLENFSQSLNNQKTYIYISYYKSGYIYKIGTSHHKVIFLNSIFAVALLVLAFLIFLLFRKSKYNKLKQRRKQAKETTKTLNSILTSMDDGVIAIDSQKKVLVLTPRAKELLIKDEDFFINDIENENYQVLKNCLSKSLENLISLKEEISVDKKVLRIYTTPIIDKSFNGVLGVISDVTRIKELEQIRSEFVANVTHELKTPLTSIRGYIELLKNPNRNFETQKQFYEIIEIEAERLQNLIDDILSLSVIEHGHVDVDIYNTNVKENVEKVVSRLSHVSEKNNVKININIDENIIINANPDRLQQLIWNLTENAIKYNKKDGQVNISSKQTDNHIEIEVSDTGIGIKNEHLARIFERFYRVDKDRSRQSGGTGLGLSIVKHILFLYEGEIFVESEYGTGTKFTIKFPIKNREI